MTFQLVDPKVNFPQKEKEILSFWHKNKVFEKSLAKNKGKKRYVFFEGPPTANAAPGIHHVLARAFKDLFPRYKTMQGFLVERKAGWDTHGLPVEIALEKELKITSKEEIEKFGVDKFNALAKKHTWSFKEAWEELTERMGFWLDLKNPYITYDPSYIESLWWIIQRAWEKGLLYKGHKVVPHCPRCGTALSSHEVALGYEEIEEDSIFVKFKVRGRKNTYILAWTTTPWTLPGNVALAVDPDIFYLEAEKNNEHLILAEALAKGILGSDFKRVRRFWGKELLGWEYEPLFPGAISQSVKNYKNAFKVYPADFVTTDEGTGVVHTAVMYGEDDYQLGEKVGLPKVHTVDEGGRFLPQVKKWAGKFVKDKEVEKGIVEDLKKRNLLFKTVSYKHDYPFCWRCETPLLYYAKDSWFLKMSQLREVLIKNNQQINWIPAHLKEGRFGEWLSEVKDWAFSRERYWGTPLPVWESKNGDRICIGSFAELRKLAKDKKKIGSPPAGGFDPHRPFVDKIVLVKNGKEYKRVPEVVDVWFDSGAMPFARWHYPFENRGRIERGVSFPADYIAEGIDQTRGWFYTLLAVATILGKGAPYRNVISLGLVMDAKGQKMSKSKGNVVDPREVIEGFGADALRWYFYTVNQPGMSKNFDLKGVREVVQRFLLTFWNVYSFFVTYACLDKFKPKKTFQPKHILDKWILSELNLLVSEITGSLEKYDVKKAGDSIEVFVDKLSNWYVRRSRRRFWKNQNDADKLSAYQSLYIVLVTLAKLIAPFMPFVSETIYLNLKQKRNPISVHLADWPKAGKIDKNRKVIDLMEKTRELVEIGLNQRERAGIKVRQPLSEFKITLKSLPQDFKELIADELNVKKVTSGKTTKLVTKLTPKLREEGLARELVRFIQIMRKKANFKVEDRIEVGIEGKGWEKVIKNFGRYISQEVLAVSLNSSKLKKFDLVEEARLNGYDVKTYIKRIKK